VNSTEAGFHLGTAAADLFDRQRLKYHDLALQPAENGNALGVAFLVIRAALSHCRMQAHSREVRWGMLWE